MSTLENTSIDNRHIELSVENDVRVLAKYGVWVDVNDNLPEFRPQIFLGDGGKLNALTSEEYLVALDLMDEDNFARLVEANYVMQAIDGTWIKHWQCPVSGIRYTNVIAWLKPCSAEQIEGGELP